MSLCRLCGLLVNGRRGPFGCSCRSMWKMGGPPAELQGNPLALRDPPEFHPGRHSSAEDARSTSGVGWPD